MAGKFAIAAIACAALAAATVPAAAAQPLILRAVGTQPGTIHLVVLGTPGDAVAVHEVVDGVRRPVATIPVLAPGVGGQPNATAWTCARASRRFVATNPRGESSSFSIRTPTCRHRIAVVAPRRGRKGARVRLRLTDTFGLGRLRARACVQAPSGRAARCREVRLPGRGRARKMRLRLTEEGRWRVVVSTRHQRTVRTIAVGVPVRGKRLPRILFTGDSMMQSLDNVVTDRLAGRAESSSAVYAGGALSKTVLINLLANARREVRRLRPKAMVVFLGANDGLPIRTRAGQVECCGEGWIAAYTRRVQRLIRGVRTAILVTMPAARDARRQPVYRAVNEGLRRAAALRPRARLVDLVPVFTPGFVYRDSLPQRGAPLRVRETDGIHISIDGAPIVASLIIEALERSARPAQALTRISQV